MMKLPTQAGRAAIAALALGALAACVPAGSPALKGTPAAAALAPAETAYLSTSDGPFTVPAVPLEKLPEPLRRQTVEYESGEAPGSVIIHPGQKFLYFITGPKTAIRYGIAVGRAGFEWAGEANVAETKTWPMWTPPPEMIERRPELQKWEKGQPGGPENPLGARAIYLKTNGRDYGYRIHGTPEWESIGHNASSGCIRMINQDVIDLYSRIQPGAKVVVLKADGTRSATLVVPPPAPKKKKPAPVTPVPAVEPVMPALPPPPPLDPELTGGPQPA